MRSEMHRQRSIHWLAIAATVGVTLGMACNSNHPGQGGDASGGGGDDDDAGAGGDGGSSDAPGVPAPPVLGAQLDRMGRAAISTVLIAPFAPDGAARTAVEDAYNQAADPSAWRTTLLQTGVTIEAELQKNMATFDALDLGLPQMSVPHQGCGNVFQYVAPAGPSSYKIAADLFADDQLYVDTAMPTCEVYLALELDAATGVAPHVTCGGRKPSHDALDVTYSVLAAGLEGLDPSNGAFAPKIAGSLAPHSDVNEAVFPFLGQPH